MPLRVRCPQCKTVLDVPTGSRPVCPKCGFAGRNAPPATEREPEAPAPAPQQGVKFTRSPAPAPQQGLQFTRTSPTPATQPAQGVRFTRTTPQGPPPQAPAAPVEVEWAQAEEGAEWPTGQEGAWPAEQTEEGWGAEGQEPAAEWAEPAPPAKKGWFGRKK